MTEPMGYEEFSDRVVTGVLDRAFMDALSQNIILDPADPTFRSLAGFIVQVTLVHLGELGRQYDAHQLAEGYVMRVSHFMQEADSQPVEEGGTS